MASRALLKLASAIFMCMMVVAPHAEAAMNCGMVSTNIGKCLPYLTGKVIAPPTACCAGIKTLNSKASTPTDRKTVCGCLKTAATAMKTLDFGKAAGLPGRCNVRIPFAISPKTDCSRVK
uniref:Non-specific lipid-transfer protein n=1 Tax=Chenopodium quinoa TaxID=63459 RepID=A0A803L3E5_CHEQI